MSPEVLDFCIERFCRCIGRPVDKVVEDFILSVVHGGGDVIEGFVIKLAHFGVPLLDALTPGFLVALLGKDHPQRVCQAVRHLYIRIQFKEYLRTFPLAWSSLLG